MSNEEQGLSPKPSTETWWDKSLGYDVEKAKNYIRGYGEGVGFPSRMELLSWIKDGESLLDVGCGSGCEYENIKAHNKEILYKGVDYAETFIFACRSLFPETTWEVQSAEALQENDQSFDNVLLRHILECLPYYETAIEEAWRVAKKRVIIVFWIPPEEKNDLVRYHNETKEANRYNRTKFFKFLEKFTDKITVKENVGKCNMFIVMEKDYEDNTV